ncbi:PREDICTED: uncharacterized protein LOC109387158 [Hipposideros armiger]|uniref:Uncharacterized protein LOC109387158 n=1 Tax=Hipposideros armiger TaxID=186990 RepID=A0A8B7RZD6_HIPAR|nr:PREDICTED: uncharacterized protein LOC109387158 [Hipposideros armiger]
MAQQPGRASRLICLQSFQACVLREASYTELDALGPLAEKAKQRAQACNTSQKWRVESGSEAIDKLELGHELHCMHIPASHTRSVAPREQKRQLSARSPQAGALRTFGSEGGDSASVSSVFSERSAVETLELGLEFLLHKHTPHSQVILGHCQGQSDLWPAVGGEAQLEVKPVTAGSPVVLIRALAEQAGSKLSFSVSLSNLPSHQAKNREVEATLKVTQEVMLPLKGLHHDRSYSMALDVAHFPQVPPSPCLTACPLPKLVFWAGEERRASLQLTRDSHTSLVLDICGRNWELSKELQLSGRHGLPALRGCCPSRTSASAKVRCSKGEAKSTFILAEQEPRFYISTRLEAAKARYTNIIKLEQTFPRSLWLLCWQEAARGSRNTREEATMVGRVRKNGVLDQAGTQASVPKDLAPPSSSNSAPFQGIWSWRPCTSLWHLCPQEVSRKMARRRPSAGASLGPFPSLPGTLACRARRVPGGGRAGDRLRLATWAAHEDLSHRAGPGHTGVPCGPHCSEHLPAFGPLLLRPRRRAGSRHELTLTAGCASPPCLRRAVLALVCFRQDEGLPRTALTSEAASPSPVTSEPASASKAVLSEDRDCGCWDSGGPHTLPQLVPPGHLWLPGAAHMHMCAPGSSSTVWHTCHQCCA